MYRLVYSSSYTTYTAGEYPSLEACQRDCAERYEIRNMVFGQDDEGILYTALWADDGIIVLKVYEVKRRERMKTRIRLTVVPMVVDGVAVYGLKDHTGCPFQPNSPYTSSDVYKYWGLYTAETPEKAFKKLVSDEYDVMEPDEPITHIVIERGDKRPEHFYTEPRDMEMFKLGKDISDFFVFKTLDGERHFIRYSEIKHISFKEI